MLEEDFRMIWSYIEPQNRMWWAFNAKKHGLHRIVIPKCWKKLSANKEGKCLADCV